MIYNTFVECLFKDQPKWEFACQELTQRLWMLAFGTGVATISKEVMSSWGDGKPNMRRYVLFFFVGIPGPMLKWIFLSSTRLMKSFECQFTVDIRTMHNLFLCWLRTPRPSHNDLSLGRTKRWLSDVDWDPKPILFLPACVAERAAGDAPPGVSCPGPMGSSILLARHQ